MVRVRAQFALLVAIVALLAAGCGDRGEQSAPPNSTAVTAQDRAVWTIPAADGRGIPVLLYHGIAERAEFSVGADAYYRVAPAAFAKQMALLDHAGYTGITLEQFSRFHAGEPVDLPEHPILITFDDARADAKRNADPVLARHGWSAVMFVDAGAVNGGDPEYATWDDLNAMQESGRWAIQLHAGRDGHENIRYGAGPGESGPFYAYRNSLLRESLADWHKRVIADLDWGERRLRRHVPGYEPLAFAPPFGAYGQIGTNDPKIPRRLSRELRERFGLIFVQQDPHLTQPSDLDVSRLQLDRTITGGALHAWLETV